MAWQSTISALQPLLPSGPALTNELLARPPFRFIHDIVRETGFATGLFTAAEQDARAMSKDLKVKYLQKLINAIAEVLGQPVAARPSKIVAGLEPEATNSMLQMLAAAVRRGGSCAGGQAVAAAGSAKAPAGAPSSSLAPAAGSVDAVHPLARTGSLPWPDHLAGAEQDEAPVVFSRLDNLLPELSCKVEEARQALAAATTTAGAAQAWSQCSKVHAIAQDAAALAKCLEALYGATHIVAAEGTAWGKEADKAAARLKDEELAAAEAAAASQQAVARLEAEVAAAQRRVQQAALAIRSRR